MLGTFPNGVRPSQPPGPPEIKDDFSGGVKCAFLATNQEHPLDAVQRVMGLRTDGACIVVGRLDYDKGRIVTSKIVIGEIEILPLNKEKIGDAIAALARKHKFTEIFADKSTVEWLKENHFWLRYCEDNGLDVELFGISRNSDPAVRQLQNATALEQGRIALFSPLKTPEIEAAIKQIGNSPRADAVSGIREAVSQYY